MTRSLKPQPLSKLLRPQDRHLGTLTERGRLLARLTGSVRACLPLPCADHCRVANFHDGQLVLVADSPAWSARLRFHAPQLIKILNQQHRLAVRKVRVIVSPSLPELRQRPPVRRTLSPTSAELLQQTAACESDPGLRAALLRLARRGRGPA